MENSKIKLGYRERDKLFKKEFTELKIKVILNWFEIFALLIVSFFLTLKITPFFNIESIIIQVAIALTIALAITLSFCCFRKYQLNITRFDKEHIYKKISDELINESKN